jgi:hypothetical protein
VRQGASWTAAYRRQLTVAAVPGPSVAAWVPPASLLLSGPGCSPRRRLPRGASSRSRGVGRCRRGRPGQQPRHGAVAGVSSRWCPPIRSWRPGSGCPAVRCPVTWGGRPEGPAVGRLLSSCPVSSRLLSIRAVSSRLVSALVGPEASVSSHAQVVALGIQVAEAGTRATLAQPRRSVGGRWRTRAGLGCGPRRPRLPAERPGQAGVRSAPRGRLRGGHRSRLQPRWLHPPRGCRPRAGCAITVGGRRRAWRPGGRTRRGQGRCRRG